MPPKRKRDNDDTKNNIKKRKCEWSEFKFTKTEQTKLNKTIKKYNKKDKNLGWVSATKTKYFLMSDQAIDWLMEYYKNEDLLKDAKHLDLLLEGGKIFEDKIFQELEDVFKDKFKIIMNKEQTQEYLRDHNMKMIREMNRHAKTLMNKGIPILGQVPLINTQNKTFGLADLVIRSDYLKVLFKNYEPDDEVSRPAPKLKMVKNKKYHYRVIDIKWTSMVLCADNKTIRNQGLFPAYKGQLAVYTAALESMQGYIPNYAYILSKAQCHKKTITKSAFDKPGIIDYQGRDKKYLELTKKAIQWIQRVKTVGRDWEYGELEPTVPEMYPNMCKSINPVFDKVKEELANMYGDPTMVWYVGPKNREIAHKNGVYDVRSDDCTLETLGIEDTNRGRVIEKIIEINKYNQNRLIEPDIIRNNIGEWKTESNDYYIDFETINYNLYVDPNVMDIDNTCYNADITFMIGIGFEYNDKVNTQDILKHMEFEKTHCNYYYYKKDEWEFVCIYLTQIDLKIEHEIYILFYLLILVRNEIIADKRARLFHWSNAEIKFVNLANNRILKNAEYSNIYEKFKKEIQWIDLCKVFTEEPIVVKGSFRFKLKHIASAFHKHGFIETKWGDEISDGFKAMIEAIKLYRNNDIENNDRFHEIVMYNEVDCHVLWEITRYLRLNHT